MEAAAKRGFVKTEEYEDRHFDFRNELNHPLPEGYHFVDPEDADGFKLAKLLWYGFGHGEKGPFEGWDQEDCSTDWTPAKSYKGVIGPMTAPAPHATHEYDMIIADENGEYVCFSGMWWVPENKLAYMEPLCTHPDHRGKGLASAALSRHYHRMKALGATHMTGGGDPFYEKLGYGKGLHWTFWKREEKKAELLQRSFYETVWERFDYVRDNIEIKEATTYDLSLRISFTEDYPYNYFSMVFVVLDEEGNPYRAKDYKFNLKDEGGHWNSEKKDDCYTFVLPINKQLQIVDPGKYQFKIEQRMPITPLVGVKELALVNN